MSVEHDQYLSWGTVSEPAAIYDHEWHCMPRSVFPSNLGLSLVVGCLVLYPVVRRLRTIH